ncbi:MAG: hypothetical protein WCQ64_14755, partial [Acidobacteriota bacterium]
MRNPFRILAAACVLALLAAAPSWQPTLAAQAPSVAAPLPARLTDAEFWKLSADLSEPNGYFQSENYVGNELSFQWVIPDLQKTVKPGGVYLGVGPDQNFTYIAALQPKIVFIVDIREGNLLQLLMYKSLIELSADRVDFAAKLFGRARPANVKADASANDILAAIYAVPADRAIYAQTLTAINAHLTKTHGFPMTTAQLRGLEQIFATFFTYGPGITYMNGNGGRGGNQFPTYWDMQVTDDGQGRNHAYMQTDAEFRAIKRLEEANLIVPVIGNFGGPKAIRAVGSWVREHGGTVTTFYTSNVEQYLFQDNIWREYYRNVATLPLDATSRFIRSAFNMGGYGGGGGIRSAQLTCGIQDLLAAFTAGKINSYYDVISFS